MKQKTQQQKKQAGAGRQGARPENDTFYIAYYVKANDVGRLAAPAGAAQEISAK